VYGGDVTGSLSPRIHNSLFSSRRLPFLYLPFSASEHRDPIERTLREDLAALAAAGILPAGLSVTNPFKAAFESIVQAIDEDDAVARTGAANTLVNVETQGGSARFLARNTDADAILEILSGRCLTGRRVAILGSGGSARAAAYAAVQAGCEVSLAGRDFSRVRRVADRFGASAVQQSELSAAEPEVLINATPLGSGDDPIPFSGALLDGCTAVIDFVYRAGGETALVCEARQRGCVVADGLEVLARQAVGQAKLFGVGDATFEEIEAILRSRRR
jgi:shikimate dehydrogenase